MSIEVATTVGAPSAVGQLGRFIPAQTPPAAGSMAKRERLEHGSVTSLYAAGFAVFRGSGDLAWVKVTVDRPLVDQMLELHTRVVQRDLIHCGASWTAQGWDGAKPVEGALASVHVNERSCWLRTHPQNQELAIETVRMDMAELLDAISTGHGTSPILWYQGALVYGGASSFGLLKRLIACGELKVEGKRNRSMTADANAAARTDSLSVGRRLLRGGRNV